MFHSFYKKKRRCKKRKSRFKISKKVGPLAYQEKNLVL